VAECSDEWIGEVLDDEPTDEELFEGLDIPPVRRAHARALHMAIRIARYRARKLRDAGDVSPSILERVRRYEDAAATLEALRDEIDPGTWSNGG
jgi:hypothetical protein